LSKEGNKESMEQLKALKQCFEDQMMTQDEFEIRRKQLIDKMTGTYSDVVTNEKKIKQQ